MVSVRRLCVAVIGVAVLGCGAPQGKPEIIMSSSMASFDGRTERPQLRVVGTLANARPGSGEVVFTAPVGEFVEGGTTQMINGLATVTYRCDPSEEAACSGPVRLGAMWDGLAASIVVTVLHPDVAAPVKWKVLPTHSLAALADAVTAGDGSTWAVGEHGAVLRLIGESWLPVSSGVSVDLLGVAALPGGAMVAVGRQSTLVRWASATAAPEVFHFDGLDDFTAVTAQGSGSVALATSAGRLGRFDGTTFDLPRAHFEDGGVYDGSGLDGGEVPTFAQHPAIRALVTVPVDGGVQTWGAGDARVVRDVGPAFEEVTSPVLANWTWVGATLDGVWLAGGRLDTQPAGQGVLVVGPDPTWRSTVIGSEPLTDAALFDAEGERFVLTASTLWRKIGDAPWENLQAPMGGRALAGSTAAGVVVVGAPGVSLLRTR